MIKCPPERSPTSFEGLLEDRLPVAPFGHKCAVPRLRYIPLLLDSRGLEFLPERSLSSLLRRLRISVYLHFNGSEVCKSCFVYLLSANYSILTGSLLFRLDQVGHLHA